ncbi:MAG: DUF542 domain-containing protein [Bacteroidetes bacterium]|nr:DUF542 domain-containing protein [Bacteroidota bacterium]
MAIRQNTVDLSQRALAQIVSADVRKAAIMQRFHLDFSCNGKLTLAEACKDAHVSLQDVMKSLSSLEQAPILPSQNLIYWDVDFLCSYIVHTHHNYIRESKRYLPDYAGQVSKNHAKNHPELLELEVVLERMFSALHNHLQTEETVLFPAIGRLFSAWNREYSQMGPDLKILISETQLAQLEKEHHEVTGWLNQIRELTDFYSVPDDACLTYRVYYAKLNEFDDDLALHMHLENNILFPKVEEMCGRFRHFIA